MVLDNNQPVFKQSDLITESYESYGQLDALGRCTYAIACIGQDLMPTQERESISQVKPTGWQSVKYDFINGKNLYNRCHLIGFQLTGENANEANLITGTRYMNVEGMLPFENMVADYIRETDNHVLYHVEPIYNDMELVARGVIMQAMSVEDQGAGICFRVFIYNNQPGVQIDYATGDSYALNGESALETYILNTSSLKIKTCDLIEKILPTTKHNPIIVDLIGE